MTRFGPDVMWRLVIADGRAHTLEFANGLSIGTPTHAM